MNSPNDTTKTPNPSPNLREQLERIGLNAVAAQLDDMLAHAARQRWSPRQLLEQLAQIEVAERAHRSLERRLRTSEIKKFKPMVNFEWSWPTRIERDVIERALTLDFLPEARNLVLVGQRSGQDHDRPEHLPRRSTGRPLRPVPHRLEAAH